MKVNLYLNFPGHTLQAFEFYRSVFGGEFGMVQLFKDTPMADQFPASVLDKVMHVSLTLPGGLELMGTDALPEMGHVCTMGNNVSISLHPQTKEEADRLFAALSQGAQVDMPMSEQFWGAYYGALADQFGVRWMINVQLEASHA